MEESKNYILSLAPKIKTKQKEYKRVLTGSLY